MTDEPRSFNLNRPEATAKDEYLYLWQTYEINLSHLICTSDQKFDARIPRMVRFMISLIAHDNIRYKAETQFDQAIAFANSQKNLSLDERNENIIRICATMCGALTSYVDQFKGLAHQLKVGELVDMSKKYYLESEGDIDDYEDEFDDEGIGIRLTKEFVRFSHTQTLTPLDVELDEEPGYICSLETDEGERVDAASTDAPDN
jgi:hypothetical protein